MSDLARQLLDDAPFPVVLSSIAADGRVAYVNAPAERLWGIVAAETIGRPSSPWWADDADRLRFRELVARDGAVSGLEVLFRRSDGSVFWGSLAAKVTTFEGVRVFFTSVTDVTDRRRAESQLQESERRFRLLAENSQDVIWTLDVATRRFTYISPAITRLRGLSVEEAMAERLEDALTPESLARALEGLARPAEPDAAPQTYDQPCRDGSIKHVEIATRVLLDAEGRPAQVLGVSRDATRRVEAEAARDRLVADLRRALTEVNQLTGLIPICSWCKHVRDDQGYWSSVERYVTERTEAHFSHSICPSCAAKNFPGEP